MKASSTLGLLRRNLSQCPQALREQAYISPIRSHLEYCSAIWDPHVVKDIDSPENIQRHAARFTVQDYSRYTSVSALLKGMDWSSLKDRRRDIRLIFLFKITKGKVAVQAEGSLVTADSHTRKRHDHKYRHLRVCTELLCQGGYCRCLQGAAAPHPLVAALTPHPHRRDTLRGLSIKYPDPDTTPHHTTSHHILIMTSGTTSHLRENVYMYPHPISPPPQMCLMQLRALNSLWQTRCTSLAMYALLGQVFRDDYNWGVIGTISPWGNRQITENSFNIFLSQFGPSGSADMLILTLLCSITFSSNIGN